MSQTNNIATQAFLLNLKLQGQSLGALSGIPKKEIKAIEDTVNACFKKKLVSVIGVKNDVVAKTIADIPIDYKKITNLSIKEYTELYIQPELQKQQIGEEVLAAIKNKLTTAGDAKIKEFLYLENTIKNNPLLKEDLQQVITNAYSDLAKLSKTSFEKLSKNNVDWDTVDYEIINNWYTSQLITEKEKKALKLTTDLGQLTQNNIKLMQALLKDGLADSVSLSKLDHKDWLNCIKDCGTSLPGGISSKEAYAEQLRYTVEMAYPNAYFTHRVISETPTIAISSLKSVEKLLKYNKEIFNTSYLNPEIIDWKGISSNDKKSLLKDAEALNELTNTYKYLELPKVLQNNRFTPERKQDVISKKLNYLQVFIDNNPETDIKTADFQKTNTTLKWSGIPAKEQEAVRKQFGAFQRVYHLTEAFDVRKKLLAADFDLSYNIVNLNSEIFAKQSGLSYKEAQQVFNIAEDMMATSSNLHELVRNAVVGDFRKLAVANENPLINAIKDLPSFKDFFGSQDFCKCEHCRSIFSPAAYFTDLMQFIDKHVATTYFDTYRKLNEVNPVKNPLHPLDLKARRSDLWSLKFTCDNTHNEITYLELVNEVLGNFVAMNEGYTWTNTGAFIKGDTFDIISKAKKQAIDLPQILPLEELRLYLSHFGLRLFDIYKAIEVSENKTDLEFLQITEDEEQLITNENLDNAYKVFGSKNLKRSGSNEFKDPFLVQEFLRYAKITRGELEELLEAKFFESVTYVFVDKEEIEPLVKFNEVLKISESFGTIIRPLDKVFLDLYYRYLRLWKKTDLSLPEFNFLMQGFGRYNLEGIPQILSKWLQLKEQLHLTIEELAGFIQDLDDSTLKFKEKPLKKRLFNIDEIEGNSLNKISIPFLIRGLGISETDLKILIDYLKWKSNKIIETKDLSQLYRYARLAKSLQITTSELIGICSLIQIQPMLLTSPVIINSIITITTQIKASSLDVADILFIVNKQTSVLHQYEYTNVAIEELVLGLRTTKPTANEIHYPEPDTKEIEQIEEGIKEYVTNQLGLSITTIIIIEPKFNSTLKALSTIKIKRDNTFEDKASTLKFTDHLNKLQGYSFLFKKLKYQKEDIDLLMNSHTTFWEITKNELETLKLHTVLKLASYSIIINSTIENEIKAQFRKDITLFTKSSYNIIQEDFESLAVLWNTSSALLFSFWKNFDFGARLRLTNFEKLKELLELGNTLHIEGKSLKSLKQTGYQQWASSRNTIKDAFASKYTEEKVLNEKLAPYEDKINALKRDALCSYILSRSEDYRFKDKGDLYHYFLLDSEMSECFKTSKIVAGISSLQLYIHRCLMNVEQTDPELGDEIKKINIAPTTIPRNEWKWRENYRVWEANRKVFLYPENYIEPSLRDTKTHIFEELEDELLQEKITQESAEAAYKKYLTQFSELTKLRYSGAYYKTKWGENPITEKYIEIRPKNDYDEPLFYLFARTNTDPYQYYYRTFKYYNGKKSWGNWIKMEVAIEAQEISSIIYRGKLYVFWTEVQDKQINKFVSGNSKSKGVHFKVYTKYAFLKEDGTWSVPQRVYLGYFFSSNNQINERVRYTQPLINSSEENQDTIIEIFKKEVFRKPYAWIDESGKFKISHIWTQNLKINAEKFTFPKHELNSFDLVIRRNTILYQIYSELLETVEFKNVGVEKHKKVLVKVTIIKKRFIGRRLVADKSFTFSKNYKFDFKFDGRNSSILIDFKFIDVIELKASKRIDINKIFIKSIGANDLVMVSDLTLGLDLNKFVNYSNTNISLNKNYYNIDHPKYNYLYKEFNLSLWNHTSFGQGYNNYIETGKNILKDKIRPTSYFSEPNIKLDLNTPIYLNTFHVDKITEVLYDNDFKHFLTIHNQKKANNNFGYGLNEPYDNYYWELFFHIPFTIANHLNANKKFKEAKWWYERIFNPMSEEEVVKQVEDFVIAKQGEYLKGNIVIVEGKPQNSVRTDQAGHYQIVADHGDIVKIRMKGSGRKIERKVDFNYRFWQFIEFRNTDISSIQQMLTNTDAIDAYKQDPFNPHAVARARTNAYQKTIVMKYIDNLLDWGDYLFTQDTRESINEALMLYQLAKDILGDRPKETGSCETTTTKILDYNTIKGHINKNGNSEFWIALENHIVTERNKGFSRSAVESISPFKNVTVNSSKLFFNAESTVSLAIEKEKGSNLKTTKYQAYDIVNQSKLAFCIPENTHLIAYWDRVDDRLFKIRHCMNISGVRRSLSLFQPPIDPALLVRVKASGLSMEDILTMINGQNNLPTYRFEVLLNKAKSFVQTVQSFGSALLSALEKKDNEELTLIRSVHEQNILKLTRRIKQQQLKEAEYNYKSSQEAYENVENRINYYENLVNTGLISWEVIQQKASKKASNYQLASERLKLMSSLLYLIPQVGSPFSMKFGGKELGDSTTGIANQITALASAQNVIASTASAEGSNQRREQEWKQQLKLARQEIKQTKQQLLAAGIRVNLAEKDIEIHETSINQTKELYDFYKNKFTGLSLYNFMSSTLSRLYRQAYNMAVEMASQTEKAYQFETDDEDTFFIEQNNWDSSKAGLLAGEQLLLQLQQMEQEYLKNNTRKPEITQTFSLALLAPEALIHLKEFGKCTFTIPELAFDLLYPGQYKRLIKSVRLSIPAVVGPYSNVSAKLTFVGGQIKKKESDANPEDHPISKNTSISTSTGVNDTGMFDFNFRDERYLPFEGGGAVNSQWQLELPATFRAFNYDSISDVLLTISYTGKNGNRATAENTLKEKILDLATDKGLFRLISLKQEFSNQFHQLVNNTPNTKVEVALTENHFPYFVKSYMHSKNIKVTSTSVYLRPKSNTSIGTNTITINNESITSWESIEGDNNHKGEIKKGKINSLTLDKWVISGELVTEEIDDIMILVNYKIIA